MSNRSYYGTILALALGAALITTAAGCRQLPGTNKEQGAAIGGLGGAAAGAAIGGSHHRLLGALLGGALGAGGGYLVGANVNRLKGNDQRAAQQAVQNAQAHPATPQEALSAPTADLNGDGFVTMDEIVAMQRAGLSDQQMLQKMRATGQVFELTQAQTNYLARNGVDQYVIDEIPQINKNVREQYLTSNPGTMNQPAPPPMNQPVPPPPGQ